ncbi:unnamed protein product [Cunninghamella echinulata]
MTLIKQASIILFTIGAFVSSEPTTTTTAPTTTTSNNNNNNYLPQQSPAWLPKFATPSNVNNGYTSTNSINTDAALDKTTLNINNYPEPWSAATVNHPEVKAVIDALDWSKVPNIKPSKADKNGNVVFDGYDDAKDPNCWWSDTNCVKPKVNYIPEDIYYCPTAGDFGLNYDDGPYNPSPDDKELNAYSEPYLYNFLAKNNNQKASLFYIGSNVVTYPSAAVRALNDGHILCVHTWSHPAMTSQTNQQVVAELYWTLRAIKEATGVTPKCWRPPFGDVDDRVRAIAWQMGMRTYLWDQDSNDWNMPGDGGGDLPWDTVNGYFEGWVDARKNGSDNQHGHITLEHELNNATVKMTEKWLPTLQQTFNVKSIHECMGITEPYWEQQWVIGTTNSSSSNTTAAMTSSSLPSSTPAPSSSSSSSNKDQSDSSTQSSKDNTSTNNGNSLTISKIGGLILSVSVILSQL